MQEIKLSAAASSSALQGVRLVGTAKAIGWALQTKCSRISGRVCALAISKPAASEPGVRAAAPGPACEPGQQGTPGICEHVCQADGKTLGRLVGVTVDPRGAVIVADDRSNTVWRVAPVQRTVATPATPRR